MTRSDALKKAQKKYCEKIKDTPEYKEKLKINGKLNYQRYKDNDELKTHRNEYAKIYYQNNKEVILKKRKVKYLEKKQLKNNLSIIKSNTILFNEDSNMHSDN